MESSERWWVLVGAGVFCGAFVTPVVLLLLDNLAQLSSLPAAGSSTAAASPVRPGSPDQRVGFLVVKAVAYASLVVAGPVLGYATYRDARTVAGAQWRPNPRLWGTFATLYPASLVVGGCYLVRRYRRVGLGAFPVDEPLDASRIRSSRWWYGIAAGPAMLVAGVGVVFVPPTDVLTFLGGIGVTVVAFHLCVTSGLALFFVGLWVDVAMIRRSRLDWRPGKRRYLFPALFVPALVPFVAATYLAVRHRRVGTP